MIKTRVFVSIILIFTLFLFQNCGEVGSKGFFNPKSFNAQKTSCDVPSSLPETLSETCLIESPNAFVPYAPQHSLWTDGAEKRRWIHLPEDSQIDTSNPDAWVFPVGTIIYKEFTRDGLRVETRQMEKVAESGTDAWRFSSYLWNVEQTDATIVAEGENVIDTLQTGHTIPRRDQCLNCHRSINGQEPVLGFSRLQFSAFQGSPSSLSNLWNARFLTHEVSDLTIVGTPVNQRALAYLHVNCGTCHRENGFCSSQTSIRMDYDPNTINSDTSNAFITLGALIPGVIDCSSANQSLLYCQVASGFMPPGIHSGIEEVDPEALTVLSDWISEIDP